MELRRTLSGALLILAMNLGIQDHLQAQVGITAMPFLQINTQARSMGMAGANVAMPHNQAGSNLNPAVIGSPGRLELSTQFMGLSSNTDFRLGTRWLPNYGSDLSFYMPSVHYSTSNWSFAYQYAHIDLEDRRTPAQDPSATKTYSLYEFSHTLSAAYRWNNYFSTGIGINYVKSRPQVRIREEGVISAKKLTFDFGLYGAYPYTFDDRLKITPSLGWSLTDFGSLVSYKDHYKDPLPIMMRGGMGLRLEYLDTFPGLPVIGENSPISIGLYRSYSKIMARLENYTPPEQDASSIEPMGPFKALFNSWDSYKYFNGQEVVSVSPGEQLMHHSGLEITLFDILSYRRGFFREDEHNGGRKYRTEGFGLHYKFISLDYVEYIFDDRSHPLANTSYYQFTVSVPAKWLSSLPGNL